MNEKSTHEMVTEILAIVKEIKAATVRDPNAIIHTPFGDIDPNAPKPEPQIPPPPVEPPVIPPPLPFSPDASIIKQLLAIGSPLTKPHENWMNEHPEYFTDQERAEFIPWYGAVGGDVQWLQLGIGWYKSDGSTGIPAGGFNPYNRGDIYNLYEAYRAWRKAGGKHPAMPERT
jgi:hypothetical protein